MKYIKSVTKIQIYRDARVCICVRISYLEHFKKRK